MPDQALAGLRVVEYAQGFSGPFCTKILADYGADVIKVESPAGDWIRGKSPFVGDDPDLEKSGLFLYLNTNKRSVTLNLASTTGRDLFRLLLNHANALVLADPPINPESAGLGASQLRKEFPSLVVLDMTSFGRTGPYATWKACDLLTFHMSGTAWITPDTVDDPPSQPPLQGPGHLAELFAGLTAAGLLMTYLVSQNIRGGHVIDLSAWDAVLHNMAREVAQFALDGSVPGRLPQSLYGFGGGGLLPCKDGFAKIYFTEHHFWIAMADLVGRPELASDERYRDRAARAKHWKSLEPVVVDFCKQYGKKELASMCQAKGIPAAPVNTVGELWEEPQVKSRRLIMNVQHPIAGRVKLPTAPFRLEETPCAPPAPAPVLGQHNAAVWCDMLGLPRADLVAFRESGVI